MIPQRSFYDLHPFHNLVACDFYTTGYTCYGFDVTTGGCSSHLGFNGEYRLPWGSLYALGRGYRIYSTVLMRFSSPDSYSPLGEAGINAYAYCAGDPVNHSDPTGHMFRRIPNRQISNGQRMSRTPRPRSRNLLDLHESSTRGGNSRSPTPSPDRRSLTSVSSLSSREPSRSPVRRGSDSDSTGSELNWSSTSSGASPGISHSPSTDNQSPLDQLEQLVRDLPQRINPPQASSVRNPGP